MKKAILVNDTSLVFHYGCQLVVDNIKKGLLENKIEISNFFYYTENGVNKKIQKYLSKEKIDLVIINGEGSIHHNRSLANELINLAKNIKKYNKNIKVCLINSTIQSMGKELKKLKYFDLINVREIKSYEYLKNKGIESILTPDLSIYTERFINKEKNNNTIIGGSVIPEKMDENIVFAKNNNLTFRDILYLPKGSNLNPLNVTKKLIYILVKKLNYTFKTKFLIQDSYNEIKNLSKNNTLVSGRFHDIYLAILSGLDFYILKSNSYKIEGTLESIGLENKYFKSINDIDIKSIGYNTNEKKLVNDFYKKGNEKIKKLFNKINKL